MTELAAAPVALDVAHARQWLERIYSTTPGRLALSYVDHAGRFHGTGGTPATIDAALERIASLDQGGARGIYLRTTTLARDLEPGERGGAADSLALPGLWADVDFGTIGHKPGPGLSLPPDAEQAWKIVTTSGLPAPTLWVHSGGGLYPWWLLDQPLVLDDATREAATRLSTGWQQALKRSAERLGYEYGAGVGDLSRVLRVPGTVNRKAAPERPCRLVQDDGTAYTLGELQAALAAVTPPAPIAPPSPRPTTGHDALGMPRQGASAFTILDEHVTFDDILAGAGWIAHHGNHPPSVAECWTRPDGPDNPCSAHTLTVNEHVLVVHSELAGLPTGGGRALTRGRVFAHLHHAGDERAAALDIYDAINGRPSTTAAAALPLPRSTPHVNPAPPNIYNLGDLGESDVRLTQEQRAEQPSTVSDTPPDPWQEPSPGDVFEQQVAAEAGRIRIRDAARTLLQEEQAEVIELPPLTRLDNFLATPDDELHYRIDGLWPTGGRVVLSAPHKAGKTTTVGNLVRALVDGDPFLDQHETAPARRVLVLDNELDERMIRRWLRAQGITNTDLVELVPLRGRLSTFNILEPATRTRWAQHLASADVLIFDCLRPALDALGLSEDKEAGRFLEALDELTREADIPETLLVHHMGHNGERSRGDSRILDWPDAVWKLVKDAEDDEDSDTRRVYFTAYGRDVDQPESLLAYDHATRRLSVAGGSRKDTRADAVTEPILDYLAANPGASKNAIEKGVEGRAEHLRKALNALVATGRVRQEKHGRAIRHTLNSSHSSPLVPDERTNPSSDLVHSSIDEGRGRGPQDVTARPTGRGRTQRRIVAGQEHHVDLDTGEIQDTSESA